MVFAGVDDIWDYIVYDATRLLLRHGFGSRAIRPLLFRLIHKQSAYAFDVSAGQPLCFRRQGNVCRDMDLDEAELLDGCQRSGHACQWQRS